MRRRHGPVDCQPNGGADVTAAQSRSFARSLDTHTIPPTRPALPQVMSRELFDWLVRERIADGALISKWRKPGYDILCSLLAIQKGNTNFGTTSHCRVPMRQRAAQARISPAVQTGCICCATGDGRFGGPIWWNTPMEETEETAEQNRAVWAQGAEEEEPEPEPLQEQQQQQQQGEEDEEEGPRPPPPGAGEEQDEDGPGELRRSQHSTGAAPDCCPCTFWVTAWCVGPAPFFAALHRPALHCAPYPAGPSRKRPHVEVEGVDSEEEEEEEEPSDAVKARLAALRG